MENNKTMEMLIEVKTQIATINTKIDNLIEAFKDFKEQQTEINKETNMRVTVLEQKPAKRYDGAVTTTISTIIATVIASVIAMFNRNN